MFWMRLIKGENWFHLLSAVKAVYFIADGGRHFILYKTIEPFDKWISSFKMLINIWLWYTMLARMIGCGGSTSRMITDIILGRIKNREPGIRK